ncbi:unnamed protein product [Mytilus edulis]|uniref:Uncharacterized protein n=1 Tax=Mytilus edulis TaxID=6550 RepID=A0A8S3VP85_MYTED|nr:unnamed protein product [Mytilus edulis]
MENCEICFKDDNRESLVKLREKGSQGIAKASSERGDDLNVESGQFVHQSCRRTYTNPTEILGYNRKKNILKKIKVKTPGLRSKSQFNFQDHCFLCGIEATKNKKKGSEVFLVRTDDFQTRIIQVCNERDDEWASEIQGRLQSISDPHAADALYHQACSVNFRTNKKIPLAFSPSPKKKENSSRGRPAAYEDYFLNIVEYLKNHDDEQITIKELVDKMNDSCGEQAYSSVYLKKKLNNHFKDNILITDISGKSSIVTLRDNATTILQNF